MRLQDTKIREKKKRLRLKKNKRAKMARRANRPKK